MWVGAKQGLLGPPTHNKPNSPLSNLKPRVAKRHETKHERPHHNQSRTLWKKHKAKVVNAPSSQSARNGKWTTRTSRTQEMRHPRCVDDVVHYAPKAQANDNGVHQKRVRNRARKATPQDQPEGKQMFAR